MSTGASQSFTASYDTTAKVVSTAVCVVLTGISAAIGSAVGLAILAIVIFLAYAYSPRGYSLAEGFIVVDRLIGTVRIPIESVREIRKAAESDLRGGVRLWGSGGLFGYYGLFWTSALGKSTWYVTNRENAVIVMTDRKTLLFSPGDVDGFLAAISATPGVTISASTRTAGSRPLAGILIGSSIGILAIAFVAFALFYSPGPPSYTLTPEHLQIHDRFYPVTVNAAAVDVANVRVVDFAVETEWQPVMRTNGFAIRNYRAGWFRVTNGKTVRLYQAGGKRLVLIPPKGDGNPILLEASQPETFVEELQREWRR